MSDLIRGSLDVRLSTRNDYAHAVGKERALDTGLFQGSPPSLQLIRRKDPICDRLVFRVVEHQKPPCEWKIREGYGDGAYFQSFEALLPEKAMELSADVPMSRQVVGFVADQPSFHIHKGRIGDVNRERSPIRLTRYDPTTWLCHPHHFRKHMFRICHVLKHPLAAACVENI